MAEGIRISLPPVISPDDTRQKREAASEGGDKSGSVDPALSLIIATWASLPEPVKIGIISMVQAVKQIPKDEEPGLKS